MTQQTIVSSIVFFAAGIAIGMRLDTWLWQRKMRAIFHAVIEKVLNEEEEMTEP